MKQRTTYNIATMTFRTKAELKGFTKDILNKYELLSKLDSNDLDFISELLKRHPEYHKKLGSGINSIIVDKAGGWGTTKCFFINRIDGSKTDFSYLHCIDNDTTKEPLKMFKEAARKAIANQTLAYLIRYQEGKNEIICELTGAKIVRAEATVDHIPPDTFDKIVRDFIEARNIDLSLIEYIGFEDNEFDKEFRKEDIKQEFADYHRQVAKLRVVSRQANLKQKRKVAEQ